MAMDGIHPVPLACPALRARIPAPATLLTRLKTLAVTVELPEGSAGAVLAVLRRSGRSVGLCGFAKDLA